MLKQQIKEDTIKAMKAGDSFATTVLRMLSSAISLKEKDLKYKQNLEKEIEFTDEQVVEAVSYEIKKRKDAIALYNQGGRAELAEKEQKEISILQKYMPEQLSEEHLKTLVAEAVQKTGAKEIKEMGKVMAELNPKIKGKADGGTVSKLVKELLTTK